MAETTTATETAAGVVDPAAWSCPAPLRDHPRVVMGHGGGGALSAELMRHLFVPAYGNETLEGLPDAATLSLGGARLAFSTDSYVVRPLFFPGGSIGDLAVNGTVNDLAMSGARAAYLSCGFILEEGTELSVVGRIAQALGAAAEAAGVTVATGDTKVVEAGHGDGVYLNTAGIGLVPEGVDIRPQRARPGDAVLVSGPIGLHGVTILSVREGLEFGGPELVSDTAPLGGLVAAMLEACRDVHVLRDPTRGGVAATLNEIATASGTGIVLSEQAVPVPEAVANACGFLGLDPLYVANEGRLVAVVPRAEADAVLAAMRAHPQGAGAALIGECVAEHPGMVVARTAFGGTRVVDLPLGEQLPRIC
ncbi:MULTISPECIES: hydrogenase expression/formation protein HypE [unclassified Streptomyces]|uniref:hydrogenase expression/formation protein HypE n=1 Tax=unclassified Streptomyces TaxID=2593676 RepID=UPI0022B6157D|nr:MULTISPECIES: hydrogenase expression/formation protein HypE [unclassified Streptomyces]MCZ7416879.1 hydrogenase expression/formation protein HypE [Streptomyces sp. WMMC897]MCZ7433304.1 hydrogenase expression/formation protein HypE [Streptomyces sp. WMMC1477]